MQWSDADLVARLQRREEVAAEQLVEQYADRLYNYAYYHSGDHHLAEDIASETFARIIEKIHGFVLRDVPFKAWVFRIAHNLLTDHFRRHKRFQNLSLEAVDWDDKVVQNQSGDWGAADGGDIAEQIVERMELHQVITTLPTDQRTVFILRFIEGLDLEQVATALDKSVVAVKSLQFRAVRNLRTALDTQNPKGAKPGTMKQTKGELFR